MLTSDPRQPALKSYSGRWTILQLRPGAPAPDVRHPGRFYAVLQSPDETTVILPEDSAADVDAHARSGPWRLYRVDGPLTHDLVGILARLSGVLAAAGIPIFAQSSYDTDWILVPADRFSAANAALEAAGYIVRRES